MSSSRNAILASLTFNVTLVLLPSIGAFLILLLTSHSFVDLTFDGSLIAASVAVVAGAVPLVLPRSLRSASNRLLSLIVFAIFFCAIQCMIYGAVYLNATAKTVDQQFHPIPLAWYSVSAILTAISLCLLLAWVRPSSRSQHTSLGAL